MWDQNVGFAIGVAQETPCQSPPIYMLGMLRKVKGYSGPSMEHDGTPYPLLSQPLCMCERPHSRFMLFPGSLAKVPGLAELEGEAVQPSSLTVRQFGAPSYHLSCSPSLHPTID
jgi:hypothetical protein